MEYFKGLQDPSELANAGQRSAAAGAAQMSQAVSRVTTKDDGVNWGQLALGLGQAAVGVMGQLKNQKIDAAASEYQMKMEQDPNWKPDYKAMSKDEIKAFNIGRLRLLDMKRAEAGYKRDLMATKKMEYDMKHATLMEEFSAGNALWTTDRKTAMKHYEKAYESVNDGYDVEFGEDGMSYTLKGPDGKPEEPVRFQSTEAMKEHLNELYKQVARPEDFARTQMGVEHQLAMDNEKALLNPIKMVNKKGDVAVRYTGLRDKKTGKALPDKYEIDGIDTNKADVVKGGYEDIKEQAAILGIQKTQEDIKTAGAQRGLIGAQIEASKASAESSRATAEHTRAETGKIADERAKLQAEAKRLEAQATKGILPAEELKNASPEYKLAYGIAAVYGDEGVTMKKALEFVLARGEANEALQAKLQIVSNMITATGGDINDADVQTAIKSLGVDEILSPKKRAGLGVGGGPAKEKPEGKGVAPAQAKKEITQEQVIAALKKKFPDAPEGTEKTSGTVKFKKTNGEWIIVK